MAVDLDLNRDFRFNWVNNQGDGSLIEQPGYDAATAKSLIQDKPKRTVSRSPSRRMD